MFIKIHYDVFSLCNSDNWLKRINYIFIRVYFSTFFGQKLLFLSLPRFGGVGKQSIFLDATTGFLRNDF